MMYTIFVEHRTKEQIIRFYNTFPITASLATLASFSFISLGNLLFIAWDEVSASWFSIAGGLAVTFTQITLFNFGLKCTSPNNNL